MKLLRFFSQRPQVNAVRLEGVIGGMGRHRGLCLASVSGMLEKAFKEKPVAVALLINSPGGSPVQSGLLASRIQQLSLEHNVPVYAFLEDVAASGGYWLACAAAEIYAHENSIVGSIGVVSGGFGFAELIKRWGIERRLYAQGEYKSLLDPFLPVKDDDVTRLHALQAEIFESFKRYIRTRRAERLKTAEAELFTGAIWTGGQALDHGLVDGLGDLHSILRQKFGETVRITQLKPHERWLKRVFGIHSSGGLNVSSWDTFGGSVEERLIWSQYGL